MYTYVNARKARNNFSDLLDQVQKEEKIIVTRFDKPVVVITSYTEFNPQYTMSKEEWDKGFLLMDEMQVKTKKIENDEAIDLVEEVIQEIS